jgi:hypothetical protein
MKVTRVIAACLAALGLSACVGGAVVPVPVASVGPTTYYYSDRYYHPDVVYHEFHRLP